MGNPCGLMIGTDVGLAARLELVLREVTIDLGIARSRSQALEFCRERSPSLLILDYDEERRETVQLLKELRERGRVLAPALWLASLPTTETMDQIRRSGAQGVLPKGADPSTVIHAVRTVISGDNFFPVNTSPATPGAKALAESERLLKILQPKESAS